MTSTLVVAFLVVHGLLHLAVWVPHPDPDPDEPPPFHPDHSGLLTLVAAPPDVVRRTAVGLAALVTATYLVAAVLLALGAAWALPAVAAAAVLGLVLKVLYFHPWLTIGLLLDAAVLLSAVADWPLRLS